MVTVVVRFATICLVLNASLGSRLKVTNVISNASKEFIHPSELCADSQRFSDGSCEMHSEYLVIAPSAEGVSDRWFSAVRGRRNMHLTARVKPAADDNKQLGDKMRTYEVKGGSPEWKQALIVPVVCPQKPSDVVIEFNLRDERSLLPNGQVGKVALRVSEIHTKRRSYDVADFKFVLDSKWCVSWSCVEEFMLQKDAKSKPHLLHEGLECGSSCHYLLSTMNKNIVKKALKHLEEAKRYYEVEERADDNGDDAEDAQDDAEDAGNLHLVAAQKRTEDYWDEVEDQAEEDKEKAWDDMRDKLASIENLLVGACGTTMPKIPLALDGKVKKDFKKKQVGKIEQYLKSLSSDLQSLSKCLRDRWFKIPGGEYAPNSHANSGCPRSRAATSYIPHYKSS